MYMSWLKKNLANLISLTRILFLPLVVYSAIYGFNNWFVFFVLASFFGDAIDGTVARKLKTESEFGRKMDSFADYIFYPVLLLTFFYLFKQDIFSNYIYILLPVSFFLIPKLIGFYYLKTYPLIHLRAWQITGYPLILWILISVYFGFNILILKIICALTFIGFVEESLIFLIRKDKVDQSINSIFQLLRK